MIAPFLPSFGVWWGRVGLGVYLLVGALVVEADDHDAEVVGRVVGHGVVE